MGGFEPKLPATKEQGDLITAAQQIVAALGTKKILSQDEKKILVDLRTQLTSLTIFDDPNTTEPAPKAKGIGEIEEHLNFVTQKIMNRIVDKTMIWESGAEDATEYRKAVEEASILTRKLETECSNKDEELDLLRKAHDVAHDVLQTAMARLEQEFEHIIVQNSQPFEPKRMSFRCSEGDVVVGSPMSMEDDSVEGSLHRETVNKMFDEFVVDLVHPDVIPDLKCIANLMCNSGYDRECSQAYVNVRKDALNRCLAILEVEQLSIEDVLKMEWVSLDSRIKKWVWAVKHFVRIYLVNERRLSDEIFGDFRSFGSLSFIESSKGSVMQLLSFGDAVAVGPRQPEKLFRVLDMYEVLLEIQPDVNSLYSDLSGETVRRDCHVVLRRLGDAVRATFLEFKNAIASDASTNPFVGGGTHHLTRYVMNYLKLLTDYSNNLNQILEEAEIDELVSSSSESPLLVDEELQTGNNTAPMAVHFRSITSVLEANLDEKSRLYKDPALQHFFLMNNIHYIAEKVSNSELKDIFGSEWIKRHNGKFQQQAMNYERATWNPVLNLLKVDGIRNPGSNSSMTNFLKERLRSFYAGFEEIYKNQTGWLIKDPHLLEDLRISTSLKVIQAYRPFVGRYSSQISKYIRYTADDLENCILDLFSGSQKALSNIQRK